MAQPSHAQRVGQGRRPKARRPWPRLPTWFVLGVAVAGTAILAVLAVAVGRLSRPDQPVTERRSPPGSVKVLAAAQPAVVAAASHDVGALDFRAGIVRPVDCGAVSGLQVAASTEQDVDLLAEVVRDGVCKGLREITAEPAPGETAEQRVVKAARLGTIIGFAAFERTGEDSTTIAGSPPRIAVNARFSNRGKTFKGYLAAVVQHELMHAGAGGAAVTAESEYAARAVESQWCGDLAVEVQGRSCSDARTLVDMGRAIAVARLRAAGYT